MQESASSNTEVLGLDDMVCTWFTKQGDTPWNSNAYKKSFPGAAAENADNQA